MIPDFARSLNHEHPARRREAAWDSAPEGRVIFRWSCGAFAQKGPAKMRRPSGALSHVESSSLSPSRHENRTFAWFFRTKPYTKP